MSRRKQSNPKPLKSDPHEKLPLDFRSETELRKGKRKNRVVFFFCVNSGTPTRAADARRPRGRGRDGAITVWQALVACPSRSPLVWKNDSEYRRFAPTTGPRRTID
ncbi:hypothetical protein TcasGA2_TC031141 [Tribolium castaneum]|uniref:Uncharacterized protein n=1 Tax=Tribolium castaneum TaxID=7070 RepID=A0A139WI76_TRICA|nr:hypothetical protein TcasGA2_TC031141 [Tribolium castaneum]